ncbi:RsmE family RNA methyltransferase [Spirochaeta lutea]|uniref:Ribosomal RNA small subunit methyltransferase E n=1 Tax=Spirochaeta lutea TaxID=1480694 RepID=A0A098R0X9_9SPIO|nr:RsmE family RNA methyltransferase [Spirochaeta lutea]KGE73421.1 hypothetical protein DC28_03920 [Spirochaeta lutea]
MNVLLFHPQEWGFPIKSEDRRYIHCRQILGLKAGQEIRVGLVGGGLGTARVLRLSKQSLELDFPGKDELEPGPGLVAVELILGHPRPPVLRRLCRDLATLGVGRISVCGTDLGEKSYFSSKVWNQELWREDLLDGASQGGGCDLPEVRRFWSVGDYLGSLEPGMPRGGDAWLDGTEARQHSRETGPVPGANPAPGSRFVLHLGEGIPALHRVLSMGMAGTDPTDGVLRIAVGPERGWTEREIQAFSAKGFAAAGLGRRIWRTEMAGLYAAALAVQYREGT